MSIPSFVLLVFFYRNNDWETVPHYLLVIGYGLYELFIDAEIEVPQWLRVRDLDDLKSKLIGVVVAILAVVFVGVFVDSNRSDDVISYGVGEIGRAHV